MLENMLVYFIIELFPIRNNRYLSVNVQPMFPHADLIEWSLSSLGLNNTNFWSVAAPRIQTGQISIKNVSKNIIYIPTVSNYWCFKFFL